MPMLEFSHVQHAGEYFAVGGADALVSLWHAQVGPLRPCISTPRRCAALCAPAPLRRPCAAPAPPLRPCTAAPLHPLHPERDHAPLRV